MRDEQLMAVGVEHPLLHFAGHLANVFFGVWCVTRAKTGFGGALGRLLVNPVVRFLGVISYGLYLYHNFAGTIVNALLRQVGRESLSSNLVANLVMMTTVTLVIAILSWVLIEKPFNNLKRLAPYFPARNVRDAAPSVQPAALT